MHRVHIQLHCFKNLVIFFLVGIGRVNTSKMKLLLLTVLVVAMAYKVRLVGDHSFRVLRIEQGGLGVKCYALFNELLMYC